MLKGLFSSFEKPKSNDIKRYMSSYEEALSFECLNISDIKIDDYKIKGFSNLICKCCNKKTPLYKIFIQHRLLMGDFDVFGVDLHLLLYDDSINNGWGVNNKKRIYSHLMKINKYYKKHEIINEEQLFMVAARMSFFECLNRVVDFPIKERLDAFSEIYNGEYYTKLLLSSGMNVFSDRAISEIANNGYYKYYDLEDRLLKILIYYSKSDEVYNEFKSMGYTIDNYYYWLTGLENGEGSIKRDIINKIIINKSKMIRIDLVDYFLKTKSEENIKLLVTNGIYPEYFSSLHINTIKNCNIETYKLIIKLGSDLCEDVIYSLETLKMVLDDGKIDVDVNKHIDTYFDDITYSDYKKYFPNNERLTKKFNIIKKNSENAIYCF